MNRTYIIMGVVVGLIAVYGLTEVSVHKKVQALLLDTQAGYQVQLSGLKNFVALSQDTGASPAAREIIVDCPGYMQTRYDELLSSLGTNLSKNALSELVTVFERCANVPLLQRAITVREFELQVDALEVLASELSRLEEDDVYNTVAADWRLLVKAEQAFNELYRELIGVQEEIVTSLAAGIPASDVSLKEVQEKGAVIQARQAAVRAEIRALREKLLGT